MTGRSHPATSRHHSPCPGPILETGAAFPFRVRSGRTRDTSVAPRLTHGKPRLLATGAAQPPEVSGTIRLTSCRCATRVERLGRSAWSPRAPRSSTPPGGHDTHQLMPILDLFEARKDVVRLPRPASSVAIRLGQGGRNDGGRDDVGKPKRFTVDLWLGCLS